MAIRELICYSIENFSHFLPFLSIFSFTKLPKMATICCMTVVAINDCTLNAKNGNKRINLLLYRELQSLFCHFWQYFASQSVIMLAKNCQKWQFLLTSKLPKMANEHSSQINHHSHFSISCNDYTSPTVCSVVPLFSLFGHQTPACLGCHCHKVCVNLLAAQHI